MWSADRPLQPSAAILSCTRQPDRPNRAPGGWRWTHHSPTGSGPEGSSPNETGRVSVQPPTFPVPAGLFPLPSRRLALAALRLPPDIQPRAMTDEFDREASGRAEAQLFGAAGLPRAAAPTAAVHATYRVLARKTRPTTFADLIGQEPMVRTLSNAFELGRIHQAYLLTGVRGVGKTTTARILARAFNYDLPAVEGREAMSRPTVHMPELGLHCQAIIDSRHVDVIEMDAASHTGIDDVREIFEKARYRPGSGRPKGCI